MRDDDEDDRAEKAIFSVQTDAGLRDKLDAQAKREGHESRSRVVRRYCMEGLERDAKRY